MLPIENTAKVRADIAAQKAKDGIKAGFNITIEVFKDTYWS